MLQKGVALPGNFVSQMAGSLLHLAAHRLVGSLEHAVLQLLGTGLPSAAAGVPKPMLCGPVHLLSLSQGLAAMVSQLLLPHCRPCSSGMVSESNSRCSGDRYGSPGTLSCSRRQACLRHPIGNAAGGWCAGTLNLCG